MRFEPTTQSWPRAERLDTIVQTEAGSRRAGRRSSRRACERAWITARHVHARSTFCVAIDLLSEAEDGLEFRRCRSARLNVVRLHAAAVPAGRQQRAAIFKGAIGLKQRGVDGVAADEAGRPACD